MASVSSAIDHSEDWVVPGSDSNWIPQKPNPSKGSGSASQTTTTSVDEDVLPDEAVPLSDDEDEMSCPKHVDHPSKLSLVPFVDTDSEEEGENNDMLIEGEYEGEDMPEIEWDRDNSNFNAGAVYKNMTELQNALTMYCIRSNNVYGSEKNEKRKLTVHFPDPKCSWKLHANGMRGNKTIQIRYNNDPHTCPAKVETHKSKLATKNWLAEVMTPWLRKDPFIGATAIGKKNQRFMALRRNYLT
ncbi:hypothetical protein D1007_43888 [Hordeum vulgare]|nr:hypothetical protein D1007_43888 [Hordeum vulgare]